MSLPRLALTALPFLTLAFGASPASAHAVHQHGLVAGFLHPLMGADHVAAMVAIGLWAASLGWRRGWLPPAGFLAGMAGGIALGLAGGIGLGFGVVETAVAGSLILLGAMLAMAQPFRPAHSERVGRAGARSASHSAAAEQAMAARCTGPSGSARISAPDSIATTGTITDDSPATWAGSRPTMENQVRLPSVIGIQVM